MSFVEIILSDLFILFYKEYIVFFSRLWDSFFYINDKNGEDILIYYIKSISKDKLGIVKIDTTSLKNRLKSGDKLTFKETKGMAELNNCKTINSFWDFSFKSFLQK